MNDNDYIELRCIYDHDEQGSQHYKNCKVCGCGLWVEDVVHEPLCFRCISWLATILLNSVLPSQNRLNRLERIEQMTHDRVDRLDQRLVQHDQEQHKHLEVWRSLEGSICKCLKRQQELEAQLLTPDAPDRAWCEWDGFEWQPVEETGS